MELQIKHLTPYLPYKLQFLMASEPESKEPNIDELKSIDTGLKMVNFGWGNAKPLTEIKPILKPKAHLHKLQNEILIRWGGGLSDRAKAQWIKETTDDMLYSATNSLRYDFIELMLENHIDIFGLIDAGLATELP
jgi:hypothetical protein